MKAIEPMTSEELHSRNETGEQNLVTKSCKLCFWWLLFETNLWMSLVNTNWAILSAILWKEYVAYSWERIILSAFASSKLDYIVLILWHNSTHVALHSWHITYYLLVLLNTVCLLEKQHIPIFEVLGLTVDHTKNQTHDLPHLRWAANLTITRIKPMIYHTWDEQLTITPPRQTNCV